MLYDYDFLVLFKSCYLITLKLLIICINNLLIDLCDRTITISQSQKIGCR